VPIPLAEEPTLAAVERHSWPDPLDPGRYRGLKDRARQLHRETDYAVVLDLNCAFFLRCCELRGWENFYMDLVADTEFAEALMDRYLAIRLPWRSGPARGGGQRRHRGGDQRRPGDDERTLISPALYRALIKPARSARLTFSRRAQAPSGTITPMGPSIR